MEAEQVGNGKEAFEQTDNWEEVVEDLGIYSDARRFQPVRLDHFPISYVWKGQREVHRPNHKGFPFRRTDPEAVQLLYWQNDHPSVVAKQQKTSIDRTLGHSDHPEPVQ